MRFTRIFWIAALLYVPIHLVPQVWKNESPWNAMTLSCIVVLFSIRGIESELGK